MLSFMGVWLQCCFRTGHRAKKNRLGKGMLVKAKAIERANKGGSMMGCLLMINQSGCLRVKRGQSSAHSKRGWVANAIQV